MTTRSSPPCAPGRAGYVLKDMDDEDISRAILAVGSGEAIFSPAIAERMMTFFSARPALPADLFPELTESERNVLKPDGPGREQ